MNRSARASQARSLQSRSARLSGLVAAGVVAALLAGCGSSVKLDETSVSERSGSQIGAGADGAAAAGAGQRSVSGVQANGMNAAGQPPASLARVVYFDLDSYAVLPEYNSVLDGHAKFLNADRKRHVNLEGHTDERGGREYNLALGNKRAEAVRRALAVSGVSDAQIEAVSFGKEKPAVQGSNEEAWAKNRRVELSHR